jgi:hypothetical protein
LRFFSVITGIVALGTEVLVFVSLMEMPPFGKGGSDIIWALPFFGLVVFALAAFGILAALRARGSPTPARNLATAGVLLNALSLLIPTVMLVLAVGRLLVSGGR